MKYPKQKLWNVKYMRRRFEERREAGLCVRCGDASPVDQTDWCDSCRQKSAQRQRVKRDNIRREAMLHYGAGIIACNCCGEKEFKFLTLDHPENDGAKHRRELMGTRHDTSQYYLRLKNLGWPKELQVLCMNCNWGRMMNGGICPHKANSAS